MKYLHCSFLGSACQPSTYHNRVAAWLGVAGLNGGGRRGRARGTGTKGRQGKGEATYETRTCERKPKRTGRGDIQTRISEQTPKRTGSRRGTQCQREITAQGRKTDLQAGEPPVHPATKCKQQPPPCTSTSVGTATRSRQRFGIHTVVAELCVKSIARGAPTPAR